MPNFINTNLIDGFAELSSNVKRLTIFYFTADFCQPCKVLIPAIEKLQNETESFDLYKVDAPSHTDLCKEHEIKAVPTMLFYKNGIMVHRTRGTMAYDKVRETIAELALDF